MTERNNDHQTPLEGMDPEKLLRVGLDTLADSPFDRETLDRAFPALEILGVLGRGGMGVVYKARQKSLDRLVALKVLPPEVAEVPGFADRFAREARALAQFSHEHIVRIHEAGQSEGLTFILMEFVDGVNLRQAQRDGKLTPEQALAIVPQICDALTYAHERGVVHRDIKPENILLTREGKVKIADFGLAKLVAGGAHEYSLTGVSQVMGTVHYIAPEQIHTPRDVDHRADIYSLGVVFYEMLTGELPLGRFLPPSEKVAVDIRIDEVVLRSLERERERRYQRVDDLKTGVESVAHAPSAAPPPPLPPAPPAVLAHPPSRKLSTLAVLGCLGIPVGIIVAVLINVLGDVRDEFANTAGGMVALIGVILSFIAYHQIKGDPERLRGRRLALWGALLPPVLAVIGLGVAFTLYQIFVEPARQRHAAIAAERAAAEAAADRARFGEILHGHLARLESLGGMAPLDEIAETIDPNCRTWFLNLSDQEFKRACDAEELGLAMIDRDSLPAPLTEFEIDRLLIQARIAEVTIRHGETRLSFTMVLYEGRWFLGVGKVVRTE